MDCGKCASLHTESFGLLLLLLLLFNTTSETDAASLQIVLYLLHFTVACFCSVSTRRGIKARDWKLTKGKKKERFCFLFP